MYDLPEFGAALDALWSALAQRLQDRGVRAVPEHLSRSADLSSLWTDPAMLLSQTCGYPLTTSLAGQVQLVATPIYTAPGCKGTDHRSAVVVAKSSRASSLLDIRGQRCVINGYDSNTGMNLLRAMVAPLAAGRAFFATVVVSGSHRESLRHVARGEADVAAIDAVTLALLHQVEPAAVAAVRILAWSPPSPGLPLITAVATDADTIAQLRAALHEIAGESGLQPHRERLQLAGFGEVPIAQYARVLGYQVQAQQLGYPELR